MLEDVKLQCEKEAFVNDLVKIAKAYGWFGDYVEIGRFVEDVIEQMGFDSKNYDLEPD
jgi:hypothetical protein